jgi:hypothetical protein
VQQGRSATDVSEPRAYTPAARQAFL